MLKSRKNNRMVERRRKEKDAYVRTKTLFISEDLFFTFCSSFPSKVNKDESGFPWPEPPEGDQLKILNQGTTKLQHSLCGIYIYISADHISAAIDSSNLHQGDDECYFNKKRVSVLFMGQCVDRKQRLQWTITRLSIPCCREREMRGIVGKTIVS